MLQPCLTFQVMTLKTHMTRVRLAAEMIWGSLLLPPTTASLWVLLITSGIYALYEETVSQYLNCMAAW